MPDAGAHESDGEPEDNRTCNQHPRQHRRPVRDRAAPGGAVTDKRPYEHNRRACRKPGPGMLRAAAADLGLDLSRSFAVGDKWTDVQVGLAAGGKGILVRTGYGRSSETSPRRPRRSVEPTFIADDLIAATAWILRQE